MNRRLANRWTADINYTWQRLYGNYDFDVPGGGGTYNTASAIDDGPGIMVTDPFRYGPLLQNRTHVFKAFGAYEVIPNLNVGAYYRFQSGAPWNALGRDVPYQGFRRYLNPVGTFHTPAWQNIDLLASYGLGLGRGMRVSVEGRVLNVLNKQTVLTVDRKQYFDFPGQPQPPGNHRGVHRRALGRVNPWLPRGRDAPAFVGKAARPRYK